MLGTPVAVPLTVAPSGNMLISKSAFLPINIWADCNSFLVKLAKFSIFLGAIPNNLPVTLGILFFKFLKFKLSISKLGTIFLIALLTLSLIPNLSAKTIFFFLGLTLTSGATSSSIAISTLSDISSVNSSPYTLWEASIALAGKYLFI